MDQIQELLTDVVIMTEGLSEELKSYFNHPSWNEWSKGEDKEVFFNKGKPLQRSELVKIVGEIYRKAGITRSVRLHDFRHTMVALMYNAGINIVSIQQQLRHARIETTIHYLPLDPVLRSLIEVSSTTNNNDG